LPKHTQLFGKLANIGDDISSNYRENSSIFKKLVTGDSITVENKGERPFMLENYATLIFWTNEMPRINDQTHDFMRRLVIIRFNAKFSADDPAYDPFIKDKLLTETGMKYLLRLAIAGLKRLLVNKQFTDSPKVAEQLKEYEKINNPVLLFVQNNEIEKQAASDVYLKYASWCRENGLSPVSNINFGRILSSKKLFKTVFKKVDGKSIRIYVAIKGH
jgi:putative DNA primase/helicase